MENHKEVEPKNKAGKKNLPDPLEHRVLVLENSLLFLEVKLRSHGIHLSEAKEVDKE